MLTGLRCRSELLSGLEAAARMKRPMSAAVLELARTVIDATDQALRESETHGENRDALGMPSLGEADGFEWKEKFKEKSVGDYVTALDLSLDHHLGRALAAVKALPIVSEEGPAPADLHAIPQAWLVDPLDGTTASLCGEMGLCGPMVACLEHGQPWMSVMLSLDGQTLGVAERGAGAAVFRVSEGGSGWLPNDGFAAIGTLKEGCLLFNPQSDSGRSHPAFVRLHDAMRTGAHAMAIESRIPHSMASLALGTRRRLAVVHDNSAEFPKQMAWDVLPAKLWVEERGGVFWGIDGTPYDIRRPMPIIAATRADIAERLVRLAHA
jgi:fructose-1,6-bisphosphatase/inositol monophosphatase family enzyme